MPISRDLIGLPVLALGQGKQLGELKDFLLDEKYELQGLLIAARDWYRQDRYVAWEQVAALGEDAVTILEDAVLNPAEQTADLAPLTGGKRALLGKKVYTVNGCELGVVEDVYLSGNLDTKIVAFELTADLLTDLRDGRKWLLNSDDVTVGEDAIVVPAGYERQLRQKPQHDQSIS